MKVIGIALVQFLIGDYKMIKKIILIVVLLVTHNLVLAQDEPIIPVSSAEKFNKRGIYNNGDLNFNGKEIISDYDGNLMLQYSTPVLLSNDLGSDVTIIYNSNVEHRCYMNGAADGYTINAPEWIIGYKGIALQTLNFETNFLVNPSFPNTAPQDVPLLISGYNFSNKLPDNSNFTKDYITILRADGSKIILENVGDIVQTGLYVEKGLNTFGYAVVDSVFDPQLNYKLRKVRYQPGDGLLYEFDEEKINLGGNLVTFRALYLKRILGYDRIIDVKFEYSYGDGFHFNNPYQTGRKILTGITSSTRRRAEGKEVDFWWTFTSPLPGDSIGTCYLNIYNYNSDDRLTLMAGYPANLFLQTQNYPQPRILYVIQISDKLNRIDSFNYYNVNDNLVLRNFDVAEEISYRFMLLKEHLSYSGKKTTYTYCKQVFDQLLDEFPNPSILRLNFTLNQFVIWDNIYSTGRDCFSNFMLSGKSVFRKEGPQHVKAYDEIYDYYKIDSLGNRTNDGSIAPSTSHGIITAITTTDDLQNPTSTRRIVKNFSRYPVERVLRFVLDAGSTIKLTSEQTYDENQEQQLVLSSLYKYDTGSFIQDTTNPNASYWPGTFTELEEEQTKYDAFGSSYTAGKHRSITDIQFDLLNFFAPGLSQPYSVKKILRHEKWFDSKSLITEKWFKNYLTAESSSDINYSNGLGYFHKIGLPKKDSIYSAAGLTKSCTIYEYYPLEPFPLRTKLKCVIEGVSDYVDTTTYTYYDEIIHFRRYGLPKSKRLGRGAIEEYFYHDGPVESNDESFFATANGNVVDDNGANQLNNFTHYGVSLTPFQTTIKFSDGRTLGSYITANNKKEKPDFEIDLNGYYSEYKYDGAGRLTRAALPGHFCFDCFNTDLSDSIRIQYTDNASGIYPINILETKKSKPESTTSMQTLVEFDSFGRLCRTSVKNDAGTFEEKSLKEFDYLGRTVEETQGGLYTSYNNYNVIGDLLSVCYEDDSQKTNTYHYGQGTIGGQTYHVKIVAADEAGKTKTSYYDLVGNLVAEQLANNNPTVFEYDSVYRLIKVTSPEGIVTTYQYDQNGNLSYKNSPDYGTYKYKYDRFNRLRFQLHVRSRELVFHNYDPLDRLLYTGVISRYSESSFNNLDADTKSSFESVKDNLVQANQYDTFESTGVFDEANLPQNYTMENLKGRLAASAYRDKPGLNQKWNFKLNSYDYCGQVKNQYVIE